jgi:hypothetical protein
VRQSRPGGCGRQAQGKHKESIYRSGRSTSRVKVHCPAWRAAKHPKKAMKVPGTLSTPAKPPATALRDESLKRSSDVAPKSAVAAPVELQPVTSSGMRGKGWGQCAKTMRRFGHPFHLQLTFVIPAAPGPSHPGLSKSTHTKTGKKRIEYYARFHPAGLHCDARPGSLITCREYRVPARSLRVLRAEYGRVTPRWSGSHARAGVGLRPIRGGT